MQGAALKRLGFYVTLIALAGLFLSSRTGAPPEGVGAPGVVPWLRLGVVVGVALLAVGLLLDLTPRRKCLHCGRGAVVGTVFCARHAQELKRAAGAASHRAHNRNDY